MRKRKWVYGFGGLLVCIVVVFVWSRYRAANANAQFDKLIQEAAQWGLPTSLEELAERHAVPEGTVNGYGLALAAHDAVDWSQVNYDYLPIAGYYQGNPAPGEPYRPEVLAETQHFLDTNSITIQKIRDAVREPAFRSPIAFGNAQTLQNAFSTVLPDLAGFRSAARVLAISAFQAVENGDVDQALDDIESIGNLALHLKSQPFFISYLVGSAISGIGLNGVERLLERTYPTTRQWERLNTLLLNLHKENDPTYTLWGDYLIEDALMETYWLGWAAYFNQGFAPISDPGETLEIGGIGVYQTLGLDTRDRLTSLKLMLDYMQALQLTVVEAMYISENLDGAVTFIPFGLGELYEDNSGNFSNAIWLKGRQKAYIEGYRILAAVARHANKHGAWPESLDVLDDETLDSIPMDPFSGDPFLITHNEERFVVYSVGRDGRDDGGYDFTEDDYIQAERGVSIRMPNLRGDKISPGEGTAEPSVER